MMKKGASECMRGVLDWPSAVVLLLAMVAFANAAMYISYAGIPFVTSDGWYFVDGFLQKYYNGGVTLQDLYMKRSVDDHAQPIHKLLLLWNADHFALDFVVESYIGLAIASVAWIAMFLAIRHDNRTHVYWWVLPAVATAASFVSLSGGMVYSWSLVTLGYLAPLVLVALALTSWHAVDRRRWLPLLLVAPLVAFTMDNTAVIAALSVILTLLMWAAKERGRGWRAVAAALAVIVGSVVAYRLASSLYFHANLTTSAGGPSLAPALLSQGWRKLLNMVLGLAALTVSDRDGLLTRLFTNPDIPHRALAICVILAHVWFWWRAALDRWNQTQFLAVAMMLFCYGAAAGIVVTRVPVFGTDYVYQQRYLMMYQLGTVALALMAAGSRWPTWQRAQHRLVSIGLAALILLQLPLSWATWHGAKYVQAYGNNVGRQIILLGRDPSVHLANCSPVLVICQADRREQIRSIELLRKYRLNAYSPAMLKRYSMEALQRDPGPAEIVAGP